MANKSSKKNTLIKNVDSLKAKAFALNTEVMNASDELVDGALLTGEQWQKLFAKAVKSGTTLFGKNQDLMLNTLENLLGQYQKGNKRFRKLISLDWRKPVELKTRTRSSAKKTLNKVEKPLNKVARKAIAATSIQTKTAQSQASIAKDDF